MSGSERGEQLDPVVSDSHQRRLDTLLGHGLAVLELGSEEAAVGLDGDVEVLDRDSQVMDAGRRHSGDPTGGS